AGEADELRRHVLRQLALAAGALRVVVEVVAELRADDEVGPLGEKRFEHRLAAAVAVGVGGVDVVDAEVEAGADQVAGLLVGVVAPPTGGDSPSPEAELGNAEIGAVESSVAHGAHRSKKISPEPA